MKLQKSIPMYISILLLLSVAIVLTTLDFTTVLSIDTKNIATSIAVKGAICYSISLYILFFYITYTTVNSFRRYLIIQQTKTKLKVTLGRINSNIEDMIKKFINDRQHISKRETNDDCCDVTKDSIFPPFERFSTKNDIDNTFRGKLDINSELYHSLNKPVKTITNDDINYLTIIHYIENIIRNKPFAWVDLPRGIVEAIEIINENDVVKTEKLKIPLVWFMLHHNNGEFLNNETGKIEYVRDNYNTVRHLVGSK